MARSKSDLKEKNFFILFHCFSYYFLFYFFGCLLASHPQHWLQMTSYLACNLLQSYAVMLVPWQGDLKSLCDVWRGECVASAEKHAFLLQLAA